MITDEELAEYWRTDTHKLNAAEELLGNMGYEYNEETGAWE
jgi:hypothetical protein